MSRQSQFCDHEANRTPVLTPFDARVNATVQHNQTQDFLDLAAYLASPASFDIPPPSLHPSNSTLPISPAALQRYLGHITPPPLNTGAAPAVSPPTWALDWSPPALENMPVDRPRHPPPASPTLAQILAAATHAFPHVSGPSSCTKNDLALSPFAPFADVFASFCVGQEMTVEDIVVPSNQRKIQVCMRFAGVEDVVPMRENAKSITISQVRPRSPPPEYA